MSDDGGGAARFEDADARNPQAGQAIPESDPRDSAIVVEYDPPPSDSTSSRPRGAVGWIVFGFAASLRTACWLMRLVAFAVAVVAVLLLGLAGVGLLGGRYPLLAALTAATLIVAGVIVAILRDRQSTRIAVAAIRSSSSELLISSLAPGSCPAGPGGARLRSALIARLLELGHAGQTFVVTPRGCDVISEPIRVPFEPRPLDEDEFTFRELVAGIRRPRPSVDARTPAVGATRQQWARRNLLVAGGVVAALLLLAVSIGLATPFGVLGAAGVCFGSMGAMMTASLLLQWVARRAARTSRLRPRPLDAARWSIANAAVVLSLPGSGGKLWDVDVLARGNSVLVAVWSVTPNANRLVGGYATVGNAHVSSTRGASAIELDMLLRAWLSPIPPPTIEQFSDWTGPPARR